MQRQSKEYRRIHMKLRSRGKASDHMCVDGCEKEAKDWSWIHGTDQQNIDNYEPRCRKCHFKYDGQYDRCFVYDRVGNQNALGHVDLVGSINRASKLTESDIPHIRELHKNGATFTAIGERYGVHRSVISRIINKTSWVHVQ